MQASQGSPEAPRHSKAQESGGTGMTAVPKGACMAAVPEGAGMAAVPEGTGLMEEVGCQKSLKNWVKPNLCAVKARF